MTTQYIEAGTILEAGMLTAKASNGIPARLFDSSWKSCEYDLSQNHMISITEMSDFDWIESDESSRHSAC